MKKSSSVAFWSAACIALSRVSLGADVPPNPDSLPVYEVTQSGLTEAQVQALCQALGVPEKDTVFQNGALSYVDPLNYLAIPTKPVTDAVLIKTLSQPASGGKMPNPVVLEAIDFDALAKSPVLDEARAAQLADAAFSPWLPPFPPPNRVVSHATFSAKYTDAHEHKISVDQQIDTTVRYHFFDDLHHEFTGPGASVEITTDAAAKVTQLRYAWRLLKPGPLVKIIPESEARARIASSLPPNTQIHLQLVYWCPPFPSGPGKPGADGNPSVNTIIPWYSVKSTHVITDSSGHTIAAPLRERLIPATDDPKYVPAIQLKAAGQGGDRIEASAEVTGGTGPYLFAWSASDPTAQAARGPSIHYTPLVRTLPKPGLSELDLTQTRATVEYLSVAVRDANGVTARAKRSLPARAHPAPINSPFLNPFPQAAPTFGCESPAEPGDFVDDRVGWQQGMANAGGGTQQFCWVGNTSWPGDYIKPSPAGSLPAQPWINGDIDYANWGVNTANIVMVNADGLPDCFAAMYPGASPDDYFNTVFLWQPGNQFGTVEMQSMRYQVNYNQSWGPSGPNDRLYWLVGLLCDCLDTSDSMGNTKGSQWAPAFGGLHIFTGFASLAADSGGAFPKSFAEKILGVSTKAETIKNAWFDACTSNNIGKAAAMGPITTSGVSDLNDCYIGQGSMGPDIGPNNPITGWWYFTQ